VPVRNAISSSVHSRMLVGTCIVIILFFICG
jgi:hypothetical protein